MMALGENEEREVERPADGPARGEPGRDEEEPGRTSQGKPGEGAANAATPEEEAGRPALEPDHPADTNERADDRARVVEPGSGKASPRA